MLNAINIALLIFIMVLALLFAFKGRIIRVMGAGIKVLFPIMTVFAVVAIFIPGVFDAAADLSLKQAGTYENIRRIDEGMNPFDDAIEDVEEGVSNFWESVGDLFDPQSDQDTKENVDENAEADATDEGESIGESTDESKGVLEANLYPALVSLISGILRLVTLIFSLVGMIILIYLSYTTGSAIEVEKLKARVKHLEDNS
jgi:energy-coupling factor transporter transmembrane protein EcfT